MNWRSNERRGNQGDDQLRETSLKTLKQQWDKIAQTYPRIRRATDAQWIDEAFDNRAMPPLQRLNNVKRQVSVILSQGIDLI